MTYPVACDVSNYTSPLSSDALACWKQQGVELVIAQAVIPPASYPRSVTREQLQACADAGLSTHAYTYLWDYDEALERFSRELHLLDGLTVPMVWVDVEDVAGADYTPGYRVGHLQAAVELVKSLGYTPGIYTGAWYWNSQMGRSTAFADLPLWFADYSSAPGTFYPFGGWTDWAIHQHAGDTNLCGVQRIDLNVVRPELLATTEQPATAEPDALAHLDAVWGKLEELKASRLTVARRRELASQGQDELVRVKQLAGLGV